MGKSEGESKNFGPNASTVRGMKGKLSELNSEFRDVAVARYGRALTISSKQDITFLMSSLSERNRIRTSRSRGLCDESTKRSIFERVKGMKFINRYDIPPTLVISRWTNSPTYAGAHRLSTVLAFKRVAIYILTSCVLRFIPVYTSVLSSYMNLNSYDVESRMVIYLIFS